MRHAADRGQLVPYIEFMPKPGKRAACRSIWIPRRIGLRYPVEVGLVGDCRHALEELLPTVAAQRRSRVPGEGAERAWRNGGTLMHKQESRLDMPMKPQVVAGELGRRLSATAIVSCDSGTITTWWARHIPAKRGQMYSCSGNLASMACGPALHHCRADRVSRAAMRGVRGRRRFLHADGRVRHGREIPTADQSRGDQEQHAGPDQVGADGVSWQSRIRLRPSAHRFRGLCARLRRARIHHRRPGHVRRDSGRGAGRAGSGADRSGGRSL